MSNCFCLLITAFPPNLEGKQAPESGGLSPLSTESLGGNTVPSTQEELGNYLWMR
jgi:hypothetical protein